MLIQKLRMIALKRCQAFILKKRHESEFKQFTKGKEILNKLQNRAKRALIVHGSCQ